MRKLLNVIIMYLALSGHTFGQTYLPLTDNMAIASNSTIKIISGNYSFADSAADGVIQILNKQNIVIDGDSVYVDGTDTLGYMILIDSSSNIILKNFEAVKGYFYAVCIRNSSNITINNNVFSNNKVDSIGWIWIKDGAALAHGGGVFIDKSSSINLYDNTMQYQNDGIALYYCDNITIYDNNLSWNTGFGIIMFYTDTCYVHHNNCSYTDRINDPSDCAALLMYVSNNNIIEYNDLTYSGDGVFLTNYLDNAPSNNYIAYNDCSYSPHNAIEATFANGNIFKHNICNYSNYGFWLGFSYNTLVDSNEISHNSGLDADGGGGIAIERGYNNVFTNNTIKNNSNGIKLFERNQIPPYNNTSHDYLIENNIFYGNRNALRSDATLRLTATNNTFTNNWNAVDISGTSGHDSIYNNTFNNTAAFYIENLSDSDIYAKNNTFAGDQSLIECKIYDKTDDPLKGEVDWSPYNSSSVGFQLNPPADMTENPSVWDAYYFVEDATPIVITWDSVDKITGNESLFISTKAGFDVILHYFPDNNEIAMWDVADTGKISFWMKIKITDPTNTIGVQEAFVRIGNSCGSYYQYSNTAPVNVLNPAINNWTLFEIPLQGDANWARTIVGSPSFSAISYIEVNVDVWQWGYDMWIDSLNISYNYQSSILDPIDLDKYLLLQNITNPFSDKTLIGFHIPAKEFVKLRILDSSGREVTTLVSEELSAGYHEVEFTSTQLASGVYYYQLETKHVRRTKELIILK